MENYKIKEGYRANPLSKEVAISYVDAVDVDRIWQYEVYEIAAKIAASQVQADVLDVGCGNGRKLELLLEPHSRSITGIDGSRANIEHCRRYNFGAWHLDDIESPSIELGQPFSLIICADVIEHVFDPDKLLAFISRHANGKTRILMSTPERDLLSEERDPFGPPPGHHIREWNKAEFADYLTSRGLRILEHKIVQNLKVVEPRIKASVRKLLDLTGLHRQERSNQVVICEIAG